MSELVPLQLPCGVAAPSEANPKHSWMLHHWQHGAALGSVLPIATHAVLAIATRWKPGPAVASSCGTKLFGRRRIIAGSARGGRHEIATGIEHDCRRRTTIPAVRD